MSMLEAESRVAINVLVVEDDDFQRIAIVSICEKCGYKVQAVSSGEECKSLLDATDGTPLWDLVFCDVWLGGAINGVDILLHIRTLFEFGISIIMVSSNDQAHIIEQCILEGADSFLLKPLSQQEVSAAKSFVVRRRRQLTKRNDSSLGITAMERAMHEPVPVEASSGMAGEAALLGDASPSAEKRPREARVVGAIRGAVSVAVSSLLDALSSQSISAVWSPASSAASATASVTASPASASTPRLPSHSPAFATTARQAPQSLGVSSLWAATTRAPSRPAPAVVVEASAIDPPQPSPQLSTEPESAMLAAGASWPPTASTGWAARTKAGVSPTKAAVSWDTVTWVAMEGAPDAADDDAAPQDEVRPSPRQTSREQTEMLVVRGARYMLSPEHAIGASCSAVGAPSDAPGPPSSRVAAAAAAASAAFGVNAEEELGNGADENALCVPYVSSSDTASDTASTAASREAGYAICRVCEHRVPRSSLIGHAERCAARHKCELSLSSELRQVQRTIISSKTASLEGLIASAVQRHHSASAPLESLARIAEEVTIVDAESLTPLDRLARLTRVMLSLVHVQRRWHRKRRGAEGDADEAPGGTSISLRTTFHNCATELQGIVSGRVTQMQEFIEELDEQRDDGTVGLASSLHSRAAARPLRTGINDFRLLRALNSGTFAHVWLAEKRTTGDVYALKAIRVDVTTLTQQGRLSEQEASLSIEQSILFRHTSAFLLKCFFSFRSAEHVFFALEYMPGGDLDGVLDACGMLRRPSKLHPPTRTRLKCELSSTLSQASSTRRACASTWRRC